MSMPVPPLKVMRSLPENCELALNSPVRSARNQLLNLKPPPPLKLLAELNSELWAEEFVLESSALLMRPDPRKLMPISPRRYQPANSSPRLAPPPP